MYSENLSEYKLADNIKLDHNDNAWIGFIWQKIGAICG
jgi:hypothetical protein